MPKGGWTRAPGVADQPAHSLGIGRARLLCPEERGQVAVEGFLVAGEGAVSAAGRGEVPAGGVQGEGQTAEPDGESLGFLCGPGPGGGVDR